MENVSKLMMLGFSTIIFAAALVITILMYDDVSEFMDLIEEHNSYRRVMAGG